MFLWPYLSPSYEGLLFGSTQIMRLINSVAIITMMISLMTYQTLIETFYLIFKPLKRFGIDAKRFAVRLYLTIEYVKTFQSKRTLRFTLNDLSSLLLFTSSRNHMNLSHIQIKEEKVNGSSLLMIISMVFTTLFLIFYL